MNTGTQTVEHGTATWRVDAPVAVRATRRSIERIPIDAITIRNEWYASVKHWMSFPVAVVLLVALAPVIAIAALAVRLTSRGPAFYRQTRVGRNGQLSSIFKLRTMVQDDEAGIGAVWSDPDYDPRITLLGRLLRKTHVDEFPQLLNVLQGHMDLIGPRPERPEMIEKLRLLIPHYTERLHVRPGISGLAQLLVGAERTPEDTERKVQHDLFYIHHLSFLLDLKIVFYTVTHFAKEFFAIFLAALALPSSVHIEQSFIDPRKERAGAGADQPAVATRELH